MFVIFSLVVGTILWFLFLKVEKTAEAPIMPLKMILSRPRSFLLFSNFLYSVCLNSVSAQRKLTLNSSKNLMILTTSPLDYLQPPPVLSGRLSHLCHCRRHPHAYPLHLRYPLRCRHRPHYRCHWPAPPYPPARRWPNSHWVPPHCNYETHVHKPSIFLHSHPRQSRHRL